VADCLCAATGVHIGTGDEVAIKLESVRSKHPQLLYESKVLRYLKGGVGLPEGSCSSTPRKHGSPRCSWVLGARTDSVCVTVLWYGVEGDYNVMVIDLLGPSLEDLFNFCNRRFSLKTGVLPPSVACICARQCMAAFSASLFHASSPSLPPVRASSPEQRRRPSLVLCPQLQTKRS
jgi:hypothetical protein